MIQVWKIEENNIFTGESYFVEEPSENEITTPITVGYIKAKWNGTEWIEGATENEVQEWKDSQSIVTTEPTTDDFLLDFEFRVSMLELGL